jgi:hypothetical protein
MTGILLLEIYDLPVRNSVCSAGDPEFSSAETRIAVHINFSRQERGDVSYHSGIGTGEEGS